AVSRTCVTRLPAVRSWRCCLVLARVGTVSIVSGLISAAVSPFHCDPPPRFLRCHRSLPPANDVDSSERNSPPASRPSSNALLLIAPLSSDWTPTEPPPFSMPSSSRPSQLHSLPSKPWSCAGHWATSTWHAGQTARSSSGDLPDGS